MFAVKGKLNFFPFYLSASYGKLSGKFAGGAELPDNSAVFFVGEGIYYYKLFFFEV